MRKGDFRDWLINTVGKDGHQASDNLSRIKRVEKAFSELWQYEIDIEKECERNQCTSILNELCKAGRARMPESINLPRNVIGLSQLRTSVRHYVDFYNYSKK